MMNDVMPSAHEKMQCFTLHDDIRVELGVADHETQLRRRQTRDTRGRPAESIARWLVANMPIADLGARHEPPRAQLCAIAHPALRAHPPPVGTPPHPPSYQTPP